MTTCICTFTANDATFDPACPFHGDNGSMVATLTRKDMRSPTTTDIPADPISGTQLGLHKCIADAEQALNTGALLAAKLGEEDVRRALVSTRSHLRKQLGRGRGLSAR